MASIEVKNIDKPDERRDFPRGHLDVLSLQGDVVFGRATFQPGWRWSESVQPIAGTESCQFRHTGYALAGRLHVRHEDGSEGEIAPGDAYVIEPGHDAWVVGDEPHVSVDFSIEIRDYARAR